MQPIERVRETARRNPGVALRAGTLGGRTEPIFENFRET